MIGDHQANPLDIQTGLHRTVLSKYQFSLRSLLVWTTLFAVYCALLGSFDDSRDAVVHWTIAVFGALLAWLPGSWMGRLLGPIGRHALAWLFAVAGGTCTFVLLLDEHMPGVFQGVVFETSLIRGTVIATIIGVIVLSADVLDAMRKQPAHTDRPEVLTSVANDAEAAVIVARLAERGVSAYATGDLAGGFRVVALGGINVMVKHADLDYAIQALTEHPNWQKRNDVDCSQFDVGKLSTDVPPTRDGGKAESPLT